MSIFRNFLLFKKTDINYYNLKIITNKQNQKINMGNKGLSKGAQANAVAGRTALGFLTFGISEAVNGIGNTIVKKKCGWCGKISSL